LGVSGAYHEAEGEGERTYYRVMKGVSGASDKSRVLDLLGDGCFKKLALRFVVDKEPDAGSAAGAASSRSSTSSECGVGVCCNGGSRACCRCGVEKERPGVSREPLLGRAGVRGRG
jgi:hypothetical protein